MSEKTKKTVLGRELGLPCSCKNQCREKLQSCETNIFNEFWNLGSWELQNSYLFGCVHIVKKKRSYPKKQKHQESHRQSNAVYSVNVNGETTRVCKTEFLNVHGLQSSKGRLNNIVSKKIKGIRVPERDKRGKHVNRLNKISDAAIQTVRNHIDSIPKYQSHYSRQENMNKVYLDHNMTIASLYSERYVPWCRDAGIEPVKEHTYRKIFCTQYNIGFKLPKSDTCKTCDDLNIQIETAKLGGNDYSGLTTRLNLHKGKARAMQSLLKSETERSQTDKKTCVVSFDLQQALPIPKLTTGPAFYCRKIWMYNLGIHDCTENIGHMFVWTENVAKRGSDEVASILLKYLSSKIGNAEHLVFFTDNCPGQNKNWLLISLWFQLVKEQKFKTITHHFLVSGHTHLPSDRDFALIEKRHRKYAPLVYSPEEWQNIIKESNKKRPFNLTVMEQEDFLNGKPLLENIKKSTSTDEHHSLNFANVFSFLFKSDNKKAFYVKHSVNGVYEPVTVVKKGRPNEISVAALKQKYVEPIKIAKKKLENVKSLLPYIPPMYHPFYNSLREDASLNIDDEVVAELI